jgi:CubicO group peptidase (beta-lactamase class C family)
MAGLLIERVSGMSYAAFLRKYIFEPLELQQTDYLDSNRIIQQRASGYTARNGIRVNAPPYTMHVAYSAGALGSTVLDLMKWQRALLENKIVSDATYHRMTTRATLNDGTPVPYGYGFFLLNMEGRPKIEHYGNIGGFRAQLAHYPEQHLHVTVLANTNPARTEVLESRIARAMMDIPEAAVTEYRVAADSLRQYAGSYVVGEAPISHRSGTTQIAFRNNALYAGQIRLLPVGEHTFVADGDPYHHYRFSVRDGQVIGLQIEREGRLIVDGVRR